MSYDSILNIHPKTISLQILLLQRYSNSIQEYQKIQINTLIYSRPSHYNAIFKDLVIWNNSEELLKCYYRSNKSKRKIPMKAIYYKNYLKFFCRPFMWNLYFDQIIQEYINQKAKTFYKQVYGSICQNKDHVVNCTEDGQKINHSKRNIIKEKEQQNCALNTIFNESARKAIDYNVETLDISNTRSNNKDEVIGNGEDFFTIGAHNDFLIDLINNLSNKKNQRNINNFGLNSRLLCLSPESTVFRDEEKKGNNHITKKHKTKLSYCTLYKQKEVSLESKPNNTKPVVISNKNPKETRGFHVYSPKFQINSKYSEFKKYSTQSKSKSKSKSKGKMNSFGVKSNITETQKPQYTFYNKSNCFKYSMDNKTSIKSPTDKKRKPSLKDDQYRKTFSNKSKINFIPKDTLSPNISGNLLISYLNNCSNSRQIKRKCENYLSVRNLSNDKTMPVQVNHLKHKSINQQSIQTNLNNNISNTAKNAKSNNNYKFSKEHSKSIQNQSNDGFEIISKKNMFRHKIDSHSNTKEGNIKVKVNLKNDQTNTNGNTNSTTASNLIIKGMICRNQSHSRIINDKSKKSNNTEVEKLINGIKRNLHSNRVSNDISSKNNKSTKQNDSSQTSSNTHQGHPHSKSPKIFDKMKDSNNAHINSNMIIKYTTKSTKQSRRSSPGNYVQMFFSQRK